MIQLVHVLILSGSLRACVQPPREETNRSVLYYCDEEKQEHTLIEITPTDDQEEVTKDIVWRKSTDREIGGETTADSH